MRARALPHARVCVCVLIFDGIRKVRQNANCTDGAVIVVVEAPKTPAHPRPLPQLTPLQDQGARFVTYPDTLEDL